MSEERGARISSRSDMNLSIIMTTYSYDHVTGAWTSCPLSHITPVEPGFNIQLDTGQYQNTNNINMIESRRFVYLVLRSITNFLSG